VLQTNGAWSLASVFARSFHFSSPKSVIQIDLLDHKIFITQLGSSVGKKKPGSHSQNGKKYDQTGQGCTYCYRYYNAKDIRQVFVHTSPVDQCYLFPRISFN
jgi:hypothetical protein